MQKTADILFEYLKNILYSPEKAVLNAEELPVEFQKLGKGMNFLAQCVQESRDFGRAMAKGDLSQNPPGPDNVLASPMKDLQNSLRHLAWQTQEVAKGDYSQTVDFMGEFSVAFNTMTRQLKERQDRLEEEKKIIEAKNAELERNLGLVMTLTNFTHNMIFAYASGGGELLFSNESAQWFMKSRPVTAGKVLEAIESKEPESLKNTPIWDIEVPGEEDAAVMEYFGVESYYFSWWDQMAMVHIVMDDTERKKKENLMYKMAYVDPLTGLNNRRYAMDRMKQLLDEGIPFAMSFIDIDYLKYCNDTFGHKSGDEYLMETASALKSLGGDVCRIGGDEFIMIQTGITAADQDDRLENLRDVLHDNIGERPYPVGFSFASCDVPACPEMSLEEYIKLTDTRMYQYKMKNRKPLHDMVYYDERIE